MVFYWNVLENNVSCPLIKKSREYRFHLYIPQYNPVKISKFISWSICSKWNFARKMIPLKDYLSILQNIPSTKISVYCFCRRQSFFSSWYTRETVSSTPFNGIRLFMSKLPIKRRMPFQRRACNPFPRVNHSTVQKLLFFWMMTPEWFSNKDICQNQ